MVPFIQLWFFPKNFFSGGMKMKKTLMVFLMISFFFYLSLALSHEQGQQSKQKSNQKESRMRSEFKVGAQLIYPNGGEELIAGQTCLIRWKSWTYTGKIYIMLKNFSSRGHADYDVGVVDEVTPGEGSYRWTVHRYPNDNCIIRLVGESMNIFSECLDASDNVFTILPDFFSSSAYLRQHNFNAMTNLRRGVSYRFQWTSNRHLKGIKILIKKGEEVIKSYSPKIKSQMKDKYLLWQWIWQVPRDIPSAKDYQIYVEAMAHKPNSKKFTKLFLKTKNNIKVF
jgi:hypothetical protein